MGKFLRGLSQLREGPSAGRECLTFATDKAGKCRQTFQHSLWFLSVYIALWTAGPLLTWNLPQSITPEKWKMTYLFKRRQQLYCCYSLQDALGCLQGTKLQRRNSASILKWNNLSFREVSEQHVSQIIILRGPLYLSCQKANSSKLRLWFGFGINRLGKKSFIFPIQAS